MHDQATLPTFSCTFFVIDGNQCMMGDLDAAFGQTFVASGSDDQSAFVWNGARLTLQLAL